MKNLSGLPPKSLPKGEIKGLIEELKEIREIATMNTAKFTRIRETQLNEMLKIDPKYVSEFIRERTRIWRHSWIIDPLDELIERYEAHLERIANSKTS